jgi:high affinity sulfate transporter 1
MPAQGILSAVRSHLPEGISPLTRAQLPVELLAGITLAAMAIPEAMGYARIAGMPVITGLYTLLVPVALFAFIGSSRHLVVGADSATAAILAAGLAGIAVAGSPDYVALASLTAILTGLILLIARIVRLGFFADFLSRTVLIGFLTGVGIQVAIGQLPAMLGLSLHGSTVEIAASIVAHLPEAGIVTLAVSLSVIAIARGWKYVTRAVPGALIALVVMIVISWLTGLQERGIAVLGPVPGGLPPLGVPAVDLSAMPGTLQAIIPLALSMVIVILAQSAATSRAYASRYGEQVNENRDIAGLAFANLGAGLSGTFVINGSPTKTQIADTAGARTQLAMLVACLVTVIVLLFLTAPLALLPEAALAAIVFLIAIGLIDIRGMHRVLQASPAEFCIALITTATVVFWTIGPAIILAIILSLAEHVRRGYRPKNSVLVTDAGGRFVPRPVTEPAQILPGLIVYRFSHSIYYANAEVLGQQVTGLAEKAGPQLRWFCIDLAAVDDIDITGGENLISLHGRLLDRNVRLAIAGASPDVRAELDRYGVTGRIGTGACFDSIGELLDWYQGETGTTAP